MTIKIRHRNSLVRKWWISVDITWLIDNFSLLYKLCKRITTIMSLTLGFCSTSIVTTGLKGICKTCASSGIATAGFLTDHTHTHTNPYSGLNNSMKVLKAANKLQKKASKIFSTINAHLSVRKYVGQLTGEQKQQ